MKSKTLLKIKIFTALVFFNFAAAAQWYPAQRRMVDDYNRQHPKAGDPFLISIIDQLRLDDHPAPPAQRLAMVSAEFKDRDCRPRALPLDFWRTPGARTLVVYLPGIFEDAQNADTKTAVKILLADKNDVLVIPNPLSGTYLKAEPTSSPTDFPVEAQVVAAAVRPFAGKYDSIHLVGASYGAFLATMVIANDDEHQFAPPTTLMFPIVDLTFSIKFLDGLIGESRRGEWTLRSLIGGGFHQKLLRLLHQMQANFFFACPRELSENIGRNMTLMEFAKDQTDALDMEKVVENFVAVAHPFFAHDEGKLSFWLDRAKARGRDQFRVLSTDDDWLNPPNILQRLPEWMRDSKHSLLRHAGGHAGIIASPWFYSFALAIMDFR